MTAKIIGKIKGNSCSHKKDKEDKETEEKENDNMDQECNVMWMFFNCDENVSSESMNPLYNSTVYRKRAGRRALWRKIKEEVSAGKIIISDDKMKDVHDAIIGGDPLVANGFMTYGFIVALDEAA